MFGLHCTSVMGLKEKLASMNYVHDIDHDAVKVLDGAEEIDILCPVSELTGLRENPLSLLTRMLKPAESEILQKTLQVLPTVKSMDGLSDDDRLDLIQHSWESGTDAEQAIYRNRIAQIADVLFADVQDKKIDKQVDKVVEASQPDVSDSKTE